MEDLIGIHFENAEGSQWEVYQVSGDLIHLRKVSSPDLINTIRQSTLISNLSDGTWIQLSGEDISSLLSPPCECGASQVSIPDHAPYCPQYIDWNDEYE